MTNSTTATHSGRPRRRPGPAAIHDIFKGILLDNEDPEDLQAHCRSLVEKIVPNCEYDQFLAQLSASNTWRARRCVIYEGSLLSTSVSDRAPHVDRIYSEIDDHTRAALSLRDPELIKSLRFVRDTESECLRRADKLNREMRTPPAK